MAADLPVPHAPLRYVVLHHDGIPEPHFDLMFETSPGSTLATWRSPAWPVELDTGFMPLPDHRAAYLTFEGPLSADRGFVRRVEAGEHLVRRDDAEALVVTLENGVTLHLPRRLP